MPIRLQLPYRRPIDLAGLFTFLGQRAVAGVEEALDGGYRRSLRLPHGAAVLELRPGPGFVHASAWLDDERDLAAAVRRCRALLDLDADPGPVLDALGEDPVIGPLVRAAPGRRVPGHVAGDELALRAVLGQQISVAAATTLAVRLVGAYGAPLERPVGAVTHLFPTATALAGADPGGLAMPAARQRALLGLARALACGEVRLDAGADRAGTERALLALPGIGPWTVSYVAMRALADADAFLPTDLGVRRGLEALGHDGRPAAAATIAEQWRPYRAYAVQHLWAQAAAPHAAHERGHGASPDRPLAKTNH
jgi:AraC family transcriptional regulator of adaptative response / DNA-3-methyladenine glycosylase II